MSKTKMLDPQKSLSIYFTSTTTNGSISKLGEIINKSNIDISATGIISTIFNYTNNLEETERDVFKAYFMRQSSVEELCFMYDFKSVDRAEQLLNSAIYNYLNMLKNDYGVK